MTKPQLFTNVTNANVTLETVGNSRMLRETIMTIDGQFIVVDFSVAIPNLQFYIHEDFDMENGKFRKTIKFEKQELCACIDNLCLVEVNNEIYMLTVQFIHHGQFMGSVQRVMFDRSTKKVNLSVLYESQSIFMRAGTPPIADPKRNCIYLIGGVGYGSGQYKRDVVKFDLEKCEWEVFNTFDMYYAMYSHSAVFWKEKYIIVFGGFLSSCCCTCNILAFNVELKEWSTLYSIFNEADDHMPVDIYPRCGSGIALVSNRWASQFDKTIPTSMLNNTLLIYGGHINTIITSITSEHTEEVKIISRNTHQVYLFHLDESEWCKQYNRHYQKRIPFNLTDYCTPQDRKLPKIHERILKTQKFNHCGFLEDDKDDSEEYKVLPVMGRNSVYPIKQKNTEQIDSMLFVEHNPPHKSIHVSLTQPALFTCVSNLATFTQLSDLLIIHTN